MADSLEQLRAQMNGDSSAFPPATGPFQPGNLAPPLPTSPEPEGFDAGDVWVFPYNLNPYVDARGHVPPPTQTRIDRFQRNMAKLMLELQKRADDAERAEAKAREASASSATESEGEDKPFDLEAAMREVDEAQALYTEAMEKIKDAVADLCSGHPTRKQLDKLPEYVLKRFANALGRKLNPEA